MPPPKPPPHFEYENEPVENDPWAGDVAPQVEFPPKAPPTQKPPTPNYSHPDYSGPEWGDSSATPIPHGSERGRGDLPPDELEVESGPTMVYDGPRYAYDDFNYMGGGGYFNAATPSEGENNGAEQPKAVDHDWETYGGGNRNSAPAGKEVPLPEDLVDLPPSRMETKADAFKEGVGESVTAKALGGTTAVLDLLKGTGGAVPSSPTEMAWNYVYNTIDNSVENVSNNVYNEHNETNTFNESTEYNTEYNTENNEYNTYNNEETHNYYYGMGQGAGSVLDTSALLAAIGAAGALAVGAIGALGTTLLGAIGAGTARGLASSVGSGGYGAPPAQLLPGEPDSDRYIGFGGGNAPSKNCEQLFQEILQLGGSADDLPEACRSKKL